MNTAKSLQKGVRKRSRPLPGDMTSAELNDLFAECIPKLRKAARRMFRSKEDSEDALQDALLLALRKIHQFEGRSSFSTWVHTIVRNTSMAHHRRAAAHPAVSTDQLSSNEEGVPEGNTFVDGRPTPEDIYAGRERSEIFQEAAGDLPKKYQPAIFLFYSRGLGEEATAKALGISLSALKAQLHRSRILLTYRIRRTFIPDVRQELMRARSLMRAGRQRSLNDWGRPRISREPWEKPSVMVSS